MTKLPKITYTTEEPHDSTKLLPPVVYLAHGAETAPTAKKPTTPRRKPVAAPAVRRPR